MADGPAYAQAIVVLHAAFAGVFYFLNRERPTRFARLFACTWALETFRAATAIPQVRNFAGLNELWFALADSSSFIATGCLLLGFADLFGMRVSRRLVQIACGAGIVLVLAGRFVWPAVISATFGAPYDDALYFSVFGNLVLIYLPVVAVRLVIFGWLLAAWRRTRLAGALIAAVFCLPYAGFALLSPLQFLYQYHPDWITFVWFVRVLGFSIGLVVLILSLQQAAVKTGAAALAAAQGLAHLGSWEFDRLEGAISCSAEMFRLWGRDPARGPMTHAEFVAAVHPDDREALSRAEAEAAGPRRTSSLQFRLVQPDGSVRWIHWQCQPAPDATGAAVRLVGTAQDVTERLLAERRIRHLNRVYAVLSAINETIVREPEPAKIFDAACRIAVERGHFRMAWIGQTHPATGMLRVTAHAGASPAVVKLVAEIVGGIPGGGTCTFTRAALRDAAHAVCDDIAHDPETVSWRAAALEAGYRSMAALPLVSKGRAFGTFNLYGAETGFFDADELRLLDELAMDISFAVEVSEREAERQRAVAALQASEERFRQLAENIREVFWLVEPGTRTILYLSPTFESIWGRSRSSVIATPRLLLEAVHPEDREAANLRGALSLAGDFDREFRIIRPEGSVRWIRARAFPVPAADGAVFRIAGVAEDITERKQMEAQLRQAQRLESIGQLSGGVAHDFNNLLTVIKGNLGLLPARILRDKDAAEFIAEAAEAADRAAALTKQLLSFGRRQVLQLRELDLNGVVTDTSRMLRRILGEDIAMQLDTASQPLWVSADPGMLEQVLLNLVVNARDAMPRGGRLWIETAPADPAEAIPPQPECSGHGPFVRLNVRDTGCGVAPEIQPRIFEPFFTTKDVGSGTGLGLATVYGIVQQHRGWITLESEVGRGATFSIFLPRVEREAATVPEPAPVPVPGRVPAGETILVVEDEESVRRLVQSILVAEGYRVLVAESGVAALEVWKQHREEIDLLLTDVIMPSGVRGFDLARRLREEKPGLCVILTSGYSPEVAGRDIPGLGDYEFLPKPFAMETLLATVRRGLDTQS